MAYVPELFTMLAFALLVAGVGLLRQQRPATGNDAWRDRPPLLFRLVRPVVSLFAHRVAQNMKPYAADIIMERLHAAGMGYAMRPEEFVVTRRVGMAVGVLLFTYCYLVVDIRQPWVIGLVWLVVPIGYFYPDIWLRDAIKRRQRLIEKQFPFFLDLLVLSMRAGLNFSSALAHSMEKMPEGPVRQEFGRMLRETRTGVSRREALAHLGRRVKLASVSNVIAAINQAEETGGELGDILVNQAAQRRAERFLRAETLANKAPVKLLLPLIGLLFPMTFVIILVPVVTKLWKTGALSFVSKFLG